MTAHVEGPNQYTVLCGRPIHCVEDEGHARKELRVALNSFTNQPILILRYIRAAGYKLRGVLGREVQCLDCCEAMRRAVRE